MAATTASCVEISTFDRLLSYEAEWRDLFEKSSCPSAFASWEWLVNWWRYFGVPGRQGEDEGNGPLLMIEARANGGELVGLIPLYYAFQSGGSTRIPVLRMVGDLEAGQENPTEEPIALLKWGYEGDVVNAIHAFLPYQPGGAEWNYASLALPNGGPAGRAEGSGTERERKSSHAFLRRKVATSEMLDLPKSWDDFRRSLSKSMRDNLKYYPKLIGRNGHTYNIHVARTSDEVRSAANTLAMLHRRRNASGRGIPHADHLPSETHRAFFRDCLAALADRKMASIYTLEIDGIPVASQSVLEDPEGICIYYSGFDTDWHMYSPLTILAAEILKEAMNRGIRQANFLNVPKSWKSRWGAKSVDRFTRTICVRWHLPSLFRCAALHCTTVYYRHFAVRSAKRDFALFDHSMANQKSTSRLI